MESHPHSTCLAIRTLAPFALALAASSPAGATQTITVTGSGVPRTSFPTSFYGGNAQQRGTFDWDTEGGLDSSTTLPDMNYSYLRIPCGTGANYWDWKAGLNMNFDPSDGPQYPSELSELCDEAEAAGATPVFVLNLLTDPTKGYTDGYSDGKEIPEYVTYSDGVGPQSPSTDVSAWPLAYQLAPSNGLLAKYRTYSTDEARIPYLELGNEYYWGKTSPNSDYGAVYPTAAPYAIVASQWAAAIAAYYTDGSYTCGTVYAYDYSGSSPQQWNSDLNVAESSEGFMPSACILHVYAAPNLPVDVAPVGGPDGYGCDLGVDLIGSAFLAWDKMNDFDFKGTDAPGGSSTRQQLPAAAPVWITEYNVNVNNTGNNYDGNTAIAQYYGTWAHALTLGAMSLKFLEPVYDSTDGKDDRWAIDVAIHHEVVGDATFGDIFQNTDGLATVQGAFWTADGTDGPPTAALAMTGPGLVTMEINSAAKGQSIAEQLVFSPAQNYLVPDFVDGTDTEVDGTDGIIVPYLYGWEFGNTDGKPQQMVLLNLSTTDESVNIGGLASSISNYVQIYNQSGKTGVYVTEATATSAQACDDDGSPANLTIISTDAPPSYSDVELQAFSLTRIVYMPTSDGTL